MAAINMVTIMMKRALRKTRSGARASTHNHKDNGDEDGNDINGGNGQVVATTCFRTAPEDSAKAVTAMTERRPKSKMSATAARARNCDPRARIRNCTATAVREHHLLLALALGIF